MFCVICVVCAIYHYPQEDAGLNPINCSAVEKPGGGCFCDKGRSHYDGKQVLYPIEVGDGNDGNGAQDTLYGRLYSSSNAAVRALRQQQQQQQHPHWYSHHSGGNRGSSSNPPVPVHPLPPMTCDHLFALFEKTGTQCSQIKGFFEQPAQLQNYRVVAASCCLPDRGQEPSPRQDCLCDGNEAAPANNRYVASRLWRQVPPHGYE